ncbi:hypothetical protein IWQ62_001022 [Dispira parvispora]|uniref:Dopey N-terminal domain-containing protein n=1 Tax=Dispira parvispora TaxID=1520584 RepID=A0A9W8E8M5_9FUNG|nr:hypothetical protein IWQ62_001022 [Dispira parvispora]
MASRYHDDPKYTKYTQLVERILQSFDYINEWADVTAFLSKLTKAFQTYPQFRVIPAKHIVAKRLAQCLNRALPAGVHQKTLDLYDLVLDKIGTDQLANDLPLYSYGLFPFMKYASMSVKPALLTIFRIHYLPLKNRLRVCIKGLVSALLFGLEEENSEYFASVLELLDGVAKNVEPSYYFQALFLCLITSPELRGAALHYLSRRLPKITQLEDVAFVIGNDPRLMVHAFAATLRDKNALVQRGMLELLVNNFPLESSLVQGADMVLLIEAAVEVILRRDMSLNRRLYLWFLSASESRQDKQDYFHRHALKPLTEALRGKFTQDTTDLVTLQSPYRILISLLDRSEIGVPLVGSLLLDALDCVYTRSSALPPDAQDKLLQTAKMFLEMCDPYLVWSKLIHTVHTAITQGESLGTEEASHHLTLLQFLTHRLYIAEEENVHLHLPLVLLATLIHLQRQLTQSVATHTNGQVVHQVLTWLGELDQRVNPSVLRLDVGLLLTLMPEADSLAEPLTPTTGLGQLASHIQISVDRFYQLDTAPEQFQDRLLSKSSIQKFLDGIIEATTDTASDTRDDSMGFTVTIRDMILYLVSGLVRWYCTHLLQPVNLISDQSFDSTPLVTLLDILQRMMSKPLHDNSSPVTSPIPNGPDMLPYLSVYLLCTNDFNLLEAGLTFLLRGIQRRELSPTILFTQLNALPWPASDHQPPVGPVDREGSVSEALVGRLWELLAPEYARYHQLVTKWLWQFTEILGLNRMEGLMSCYLTNPDPTCRERALVHFRVFWSLSERMSTPPVGLAPMAGVALTQAKLPNLIYHRFHPFLAFGRLVLLLLENITDSTNEPATNLQRATEAWVRENLHHPQRILHVFLALFLLDPSMQRDVREWHPTNHGENPPSLALLLYRQAFNVEQMAYVIQQFQRFCKLAGQPLFQWMLTTPLSDPVVALVVDLDKSDQLGSADPDGPPSSTPSSDTPPALAALMQLQSSATYMDLFLEIIFRFAVTHQNIAPVVSWTAHAETTTKSDPAIHIHPIQIAALRVAGFLVSQLPSLALVTSHQAQDCVIYQLYYCVQTGLLDLQPELLRVLLALVAIPTNTVPLPLVAKDLPQDLTDRLASVNMDRTFSSGESNRLNNAALFQHVPQRLDGQNYSRRAYPQVHEGGGVGSGGSRSLVPSEVATGGSRLDDNSLFTRTLLDAVSLSSNRPVLRVWMDSLGLVMDHLASGFSRTLWPVVVLICLQLKETLDPVKTDIDQMPKVPNSGSTRQASRLSPAGPGLNASPGGNRSFMPCFSDDTEVKGGVIRTDHSGHHPDPATKYLPVANSYANPPVHEQILTLIDGLQYLLVYCLANQGMTRHLIRTSDTQLWMQNGVYQALTQARHRHQRSSSKSTAGVQESSPSSNDQPSKSTTKLGSTNKTASAPVPNSRQPSHSFHNGSSGLRFLADAVTNVFVGSQEPISSPTPRNTRRTVRDVVVEELPSIFKVILDLWSIVHGGAEIPTLLSLPARDITHRLHCFLTDLVAVCPVVVYESLVETWYHENRGFDFSNLPVVPEALLPATALLRGETRRNSRSSLEVADDHLPVALRGFLMHLRTHTGYRSRVLDMLRSLPNVTDEILLVLTMDAVLARNLGGTVGYFPGVGTTSRVDDPYSAGVRRPPSEYHSPMPRSGSSGASFASDSTSPGTSVADHDKLRKFAGYLATAHEGSYYKPVFGQLSELSLLKFLEAYLTLTDIPVQVLQRITPALLALTQAYTATPVNVHRNAMALLARVCTTFYLHLATAARLDDMKLRAPSALWEVYYKLVDRCVVITGRLLEAPALTQLRPPSGSSADLTVEHRTKHSPKPKAGNDTVRDTAPFELPDEKLACQLLQYLEQVVTPWGNVLIPETEKLQSLAASFMYHIGTPFLRGRLTFINPVLTLTGANTAYAVHPFAPGSHLQERTLIPYQLAHHIVQILGHFSYLSVVYKTWKKDAWDYFMDANGFFFNYGMTRALLKHWGKLVGTVAATEKDRITEILTRLTTVSPSNIFVNKEAEANSRALLLRKLSFVIYSGQNDQYAPLVPAIQEKLVDLLKSSQIPVVVHMEIYLCLRTLLCRFSSHYLANFWPVLLTDMLQVCHQVLTAQVDKEPVELVNLFLAVCKLLDTLVVLGTPEFQIHQWIFITDTMDALSGMQRRGYALIEEISLRMAPTLTSPPSTTSSPALPDSSPDSSPKVQNSRKESASALVQRRRPMLTMSAVDSLSQLEPFIHHISQHAYHETFDLRPPDLDFVQSILLDDMLFTTIYDDGGLAVDQRGGSSAQPPYLPRLREGPSIILNDILAGI